VSEGAVVARVVKLALDPFGREALEDRAATLAVPPEAIVRQAALYYLALRGAERSAFRVPRFLREAEGAAPMAVSLELHEADWATLEVEAVHQHVSLDVLLKHATLLFLADVDSGRAAMRILDDPDEDDSA
jgi:hypothetical protein